jgi:hypothetical protein
MESAKNLIDGSSWARAFLINPQNLLTTLVPDFFGNPVTRNNWGSFSYVEMQGYAGIATILLSLLAVMTIKMSGLTKTGHSLIKFFVFLILAATIFAVDNPIGRLLINLKIPVVSGSSPSRLMGIIDFGLAVLTAFGLDFISKIDKKKQFRPVWAIVILLSVIFAGMWIWTFVSTNPSALVTRRNLIFPSIIFSSIIVVSLSLSFVSKKIYSLLLTLEF